MMTAGDSNITRLYFKNPSFAHRKYMTNWRIFGKLLKFNHTVIGSFKVNQISEFSRRLLIASANPLFREGLHRLYASQWNAQNVRVEMATTMEETLNCLESRQPDLVIVDHDDKTINRGEFLNRFVTGEMPMKVLLVSLASSEPIVIYNRKHLTAAQVEDWLANPWDE
jgi:CheY-like chemotaxis protein